MKLYIATITALRTGVLPLFIVHTLSKCKTQDIKGEQLRYKIGIFFIIMGIVSPLVGLAVPAMGFDTTTTTSLVAFFMVGGPEVFIILGGAIAGKEAVDAIKSKLFAPAGKRRYRFGVALLLIGLVGNWVFAYVDLLELYVLTLHEMLIITVIFDLMAIAGMLLMGKAFFIKLVRLLTYEGEKTFEKDLSNT